jgi:hypothetical protein
MENRQGLRHRTYKGGSVSLKTGIVSCVIRNMSETGACLEFNDAALVPDAFRLIVKPEIISRNCTVAWRKNDRIGVRFS